MKRGIDISKWQDTVDFVKVKDAGIEFVIIRSSYRKSVDPKFFEYVKGCRDNDIPVDGIYHFMYALSNKQALEEAMFAVQLAVNAGIEKGKYIFSDFEYDTVTKAAASGIILTKKECNDFTRVFCEYVESQGYKAGIYTNIDFYKNWYKSELLNRYNIWLADYSGGPDYECLYQQYTSKGKVNGIKGNVYMNRFYGDGVKSSRQTVVDLALSWEGLNESDGSYKSIIDTYNSYNGKFPRGVKMDYSWSWCACTWSALAIKLGYTNIMPIEISCGYLIERAKEMGCWIEEDNYIPRPGDAVLYDWGDNGVNDNTGWPEHVGIIVEVHEDAGYLVVLEGNYDNAVKKRTLSINGRFIRGFITPKYDENVVTPPIQSSGKDVSTVAREVIAGTWGTGVNRKKALESAGYDYKEVQKVVNDILNGSADRPAPEVNTQSDVVSKSITATCAAKKRDNDVAGTYLTTADLYCRNDAGTNKKALCCIPKGTSVKCYGYYSESNGVKWLYIQFTLGGVRYTGFSSGKYLTKQ